MSTPDHIGFSGSRFGMTEQQSISVRNLLEERRHILSQGWFHHGDCVGSDAQACEIARNLGYKIYRHPPLEKKMNANCPYDATDPEYSYHGRNQRIVKATSLLIATPRDNTGSGGTWWTIICARRMKRPRIIVLRDGTKITEEGLEHG